MGHSMVAYAYLCAFLIGLTFKPSHGCSDKNVIEALYACSKPRGDLNRVGKSPQSTHYQICQAFEQYVKCMEPRVQNCDKKLIEAYTIMKERYSMDGRFNCDIFPTTPTTTTTTTTMMTQPMTTEETTSLFMSTETKEVTTMIPDIINTENVITTAVITSLLDIHTEPTQSRSSRNWAMPYVTTMSSFMLFLLLFLVSE